MLDMLEHSISSLIKEGHLNLVQHNCKYNRNIGKALLYTIFQGIAQRGDDEKEFSLNYGN